MSRTGFEPKEREKATHLAASTLGTGNFPLFPKRAEEHLKLLMAFPALKFVDGHDKPHHQSIS